MYFYVQKFIYAKAFVLFCNTTDVTWLISVSALGFSILFGDLAHHPDLIVSAYFASVL